MKLTKEQVYINLQGKTKEELTDLWEFLTSNGEKPLRSFEQFLEYSELGGYTSTLAYREGGYNDWINSHSHGKTEVTIDQLKEIIKPMGTFTPIAMRCTQKQFDAVKQKLVNKINSVTSFFKYPYLVNNDTCNNFISNVDKTFVHFSKAKEVHEEWNEEIFLKACGIEVETLQEKALRLENELKEVNKKIEEENKPKIGDWCMFYDDKKTKFSISKLNKIDGDIRFSYETSTGAYYNYAEKITNKELIKLLENE